MPVLPFYPSLESGTSGLSALYDILFHLTLSLASSQICFSSETLYILPLFLTVPGYYLSLFPISSGHFSALTFFTIIPPSAKIIPCVQCVQCI